MVSVVHQGRAAVDQRYGLGHVSVPSVSKLCLCVVKHLHLPLEAGNMEGL